MKRFFNWLLYAEWYKGGDAGDGMLMSLFSGCFFIVLALAGFISIISIIIYLITLP